MSRDTATRYPGLTGLGLRRELIDDLLAAPAGQVDFLELAPENWMEMGGSSRRKLDALAERYPLVCHGLSLSLGGPAPLDEGFLLRLKAFLDHYHIELYTEHLSYCSDDGHLYDLLPLPFTAEAVRHVAQRIRRVQQILERPLAVENASFYVHAPISEMNELQFIQAVLDAADCQLHLDVNNIHVNSVNFAYDASAFLAALPAGRVNYIHVAGHYRQSADLIIDTHGADVIDPVWVLLQQAYSHCGIQPTLLERDFNIPPLAELQLELEQIRAIQQRVRNAEACHG